MRALARGRRSPHGGRHGRRGHHLVACGLLPETITSHSRIGVVLRGCGTFWRWRPRRRRGHELFPRSAAEPCDAHGAHAPSPRRGKLHAMEPPPARTQRVSAALPVSAVVLEGHREDHEAGFAVPRRSRSLSAGSGHLAAPLLGCRHCCARLPRADHHAPPGLAKRSAEPEPCSLVRRGRDRSRSAPT